MLIKVLPKELHIRKMIKSLGGNWNPNKKLWELSYQDVEMLGLKHRIIFEKEF